MFTSQRAGWTQQEDKTMIIRAKTFRAWFKANLQESARDIASHGADCGFPCITYTCETLAREVEAQ
jgi:hypothetical protein